MSILVIILIILVAVGLPVLAYQMGKREWLRPIVYSIAGLGILGFSIFCIADLNYYYNVKGGIYGVLTGVFNTNQVEQDNLNFSLKNIELTQEFENKYSATIMINNSINIENKYYEIFVNGIPCTYSEVDTIHATGSYGYVFYDDSMEEILTDTLNFNFAFYENYSTLKVSTNGGTEAVKNWNSYFNKNNFLVSIEESTNITDSEMNLVEGNVSNFKMITYYNGSEVHYQTYFDSTKQITWINKNPVQQGLVFAGWSLDGVNVVENLTSKNNLKVYAIFVEEILFQESETVESVKIYPSNITNSCQLDLNEYFDFTFPKNVTITFELHAENENVQGKYFAIEGEISTGQKIECIRSDYGIHFATVELVKNGVINISLGEDVPKLLNVELWIKSVKAF